MGPVTPLKDLEEEEDRVFRGPSSEPTVFHSGFSVNSSKALNSLNAIASALYLNTENSYLHQYASQPCLCLGLYPHPILSH